MPRFLNLEKRLLRSRLRTRNCEENARRDAENAEHKARIEELEITHETRDILTTGQEQNHVTKNLETSEKYN